MPRLPPISALRAVPPVPTCNSLCAVATPTVSAKPTLAKLVTFNPVAVSIPTVMSGVPVSPLAVVAIPITLPVTLPRTSPVRSPSKLLNVATPVVLLILSGSLSLSTVPAVILSASSSVILLP